MTLPPPPERVWFGSYEWAVVPVLSEDPRLDTAEGITYFDEIEEHGEQYTIYYANDRPARQVFDTLWHEFTHALNFAHGIKCKSRSSRKNDETIATAHGHAWTQAFLDNPKLIEWVDLAVNFIKSQQENVEA